MDSIIDFAKQHATLLSAVFALILLITLYFVFNAEKMVAAKIQKLRREKKILLVDDKHFPYFDELAVSYNIEKEKDLDAEKMEQILDGVYSIILLDIKGVGKKLKIHNEGFGIIEYIKNQKPSQKIIVFSDEEWGLQHQDILERADKRFAKTKGLLSFKSAIDDMLLGNSMELLSKLAALMRVLKIWKKNLSKLSISVYA
ncbi:MAG: hypothetical protein LUG19_11410 [Desulfovibrio sp.]|uniref:hypothetical protein n=1 Tax=Desulfovibrio sp. TaxID=885 RepID=UPI002590CAAE|nr:hypothetical protein [Desulfovibrio sp.]MCD7984838.1 hypothetical protein [Desulfovibrio sp.]